MTVRSMMERVMRATGDKCKGWKATEVVERREGKWDKVRCFPKVDARNGADR